MPIWVLVECLHIFLQYFEKNAASAYQEHLKPGPDMVVCSFSISSPDKPNLQNVFRRYYVGCFSANKEWSLFVVFLAKSVFAKNCQNYFVPIQKMWKMFLTPTNLSKNISHHYTFNSAHTPSIKKERSLR